MSFFSYGDVIPKMSELHGHIRFNMNFAISIL
jgi:hypothetical protein